MTEWDKEQIRAECEANGFAWAEARYATVPLTPDESAVLKEWIIAFKRREQEDADKRQMHLAKEAVEAAKLSAQAAVDSAKHAKDSARGTLVAAVIAGVALIAAFAQAIAAFVKP